MQYLSMLSFLFFVLLLSYTFSLQAYATATTKPPPPNNETILETSKGLCRGCGPESLQFLTDQNIVRAAHGLGALAWDSKVEDYAKWWAGERKGDCKLEHSDLGFKYGENVFWGGGDSWTPADAVQAWAEEEKYYNYDTNSCKAGQMCGHYTQIVWKTTERVGCARVVCDDGNVFMTCNYDPPGNYVGEKPY